MAAGRIRVVDDYLPAHAFQALLQALTDPAFPWEDSPVLTVAAAAAAGLAPEDNRQQVHGFLLDKRSLRLRSPQLPLVEPVLQRLGGTGWLKVKANRTPGRDRHIVYGLHVDTRKAGATTAILYLNTNDGYTLFEDGTQVASVANRLAIFDASVRHTGVSCTDAAQRLVLNFNFAASPPVHFA